MAVARVRQADEMTVSLREYLEHVGDERERRMEARFTSMQTAIDLAARELAVRLEGMNEIRAQLGTQRAEFATNEKFDTWGAGMATRIEALMKQVDQVGTTARETTEREVDALRERHDRDIKTVNDDIRSLRESRSETTGVRTSSRELLAYAIAIAGIAAAFLSRYIH